MKYFYTNQALNLILDRNSDGVIDWEICGFNVKEVSKSVINGSQGETSNGEYVTVIPISDETAFNKALGGLVSTSTNQEAARVIEEQEANQVISDIKATRESKLQ